MLNEVRKELDSKAREAIFLGYSGNSKAYVVASTDGSETRAPKVWVSRNVNFNDDAFPYQRGSAVTQRESEDDDASQSDVDDLKSRLDEECEATSTETHAIQGELEDNINPDEGTPNVTDSTTAVQQTTTRCTGRTRRAPQHFGDYVTGRNWKYSRRLGGSQLESSDGQRVQVTGRKWCLGASQATTRTRHHQRKVAFCP